MAFKRPFKKFNEEAFLDDFRDVPSLCVWRTGWYLHVLVLTMGNQVLDNHAPIRKYYRRPQRKSVFITTEIRNVMRVRDQMKRKFYKSRDSLERENYRKMWNEVVSMRRKAAIQHFTKICEGKSFWQTIIPYINSRKNKNTGLIVLKEEEKLIRDKQQVSETFNEFFTSRRSPDSYQKNPTPSHITYNVIPILHLTSNISNRDKRGEEKHETKRSSRLWSHSSKFSEVVLMKFKAWNEEVYLWIMNYWP